MGQKPSKDRLRAIRVNVLEISNIVHSNTINSNHLTSEDRNRYVDLLQSYSQELQFFLSKSVKASKLNSVHRLIQMALQELEGMNIRSTLRRIDSDIHYLTRLQAKERSLEDLDRISNSLQVLNRDLNLDNFREEKDTFTNLKHKVDTVEEVSEEVSARKSEVFTVVSSVENLFLQLEMEERLKMAEEKHHQNKLDLRRFVGVSTSKCYNSHRRFLEELREEVVKILEVSEKVVERKKYLVFNIDNNIVAMDQKVRENEAKIRREVEKESSNKDLVRILVQSYKSFEEGFSAKCDTAELKDIFNQLSEVKTKIDQKLQLLQMQMSPSSEVPGLGGGFTRLEVLQRELEVVRRQIETTTHTQPDYKKTITKLEEYKAEVKRLENGKFQDNLLKYIEGIVELLDSKRLKGTTTSGDMLIDLISVSVSVNELGERIQRHHFSHSDIDSMKDTLEEHLDYVKHLKLSPGKNNVRKLRDYVEIQIESHLSNLRKIEISAINEERQFLV